MKKAMAYPFEGSISIFAATKDKGLHDPSKNPHVGWQVCQNGAGAVGPLHRKLSQAQKWAREEFSNIIGWDQDRLSKNYYYALVKE